MWFLCFPKHTATAKASRLRGCNVPHSPFPIFKFCKQAWKVLLNPSLLRIPFRRISCITTSIGLRILRVRCSFLCNGVLANLTFSFRSLNHATRFSRMMMMMMMMKPQEIFPIQIQMLANLHLVCDGKKASCSFAHFVAYIHKSLFFL
jgi:hypothetical protein